MNQSRKEKRALKKELKQMRKVLIREQKKAKLELMKALVKFGQEMREEE